MWWVLGENSFSDSILFKNSFCLVKNEHNIDTKTNLYPKNYKTKAFETYDNSINISESDQSKFQRNFGDKVKKVNPQKSLK